MTGAHDRVAARAAGAAVGLQASAAVPPLPDQIHPVAWFGKAMGGIEQRLWRDGRAPGVAYAGAGVALGALAGAATRSTAAAVAVTAAGAQLRSVAQEIGSLTRQGRLDDARRALPALVGRDPSGLDASGIAAAVIESLAENTVDAVFAPALWGAIAGPAGAGAYRAANTMDAMVGHRNARYERFGWAAARLDDVANLVPARAFAVAVAGVRRDRARHVWTTVRRDAGAHPSPNAGVAEAAVAGALGVELGGPLRYGTVDEDRPRLGDGPRPGPADIPAAVDLVARAEASLVAALSGAAVALWLRRLLVPNRRGTAEVRP